MPRVHVTVVVPRQEFHFDYDEDDWNYAVETDGVGYLMDLDLSDINTDMEVYSEDGERVVVW